MKTKDVERALIKSLDHMEIRSLRTCQIDPFHECDVLGITRSGYAVEYEIKVSRNDFKADFKKPKHELMKKGLGKKISRFYFVVPKGMVTLEEVPSYAGLIYVEKYTSTYILKEVKKAPRLKSSRVTSKDREKIYRSIMFRWLSDQTK